MDYYDRKWWHEKLRVAWRIDKEPRYQRGVTREYTRYQRVLEWFLSYQRADLKVMKQQAKNMAYCVVYPPPRW